VNVLQAAQRVVGVDLRGTQARMAEQLLHCGQFCPPVQQVGGKRMAQDVGAGLVQAADQIQVVIHPRYTNEG